MGSVPLCDLNLEQLVMIAQKELGMTRAQAAARVQIHREQGLREDIQEHREMLQQQTEPMKQLPVEMEHMTFDELMNEVQLRGIPMLGPSSYSTRQTLMRQIRDDVDARIWGLRPDPEAQDPWGKSKGKMCSKDRTTELANGLSPEWVSAMRDLTRHLPASVAEQALETWCGLTMAGREPVPEPYTRAESAASEKRTTLTQLREAPIYPTLVDGEGLKWEVTHPPRDASQGLRTQDQAQAASSSCLPQPRSLSEFLEQPQERATLKDGYFIANKPPTPPTTSSWELIANSSQETSSQFMEEAMELARVANALREGPPHWQLDLATFEDKSTQCPEQTPFWSLSKSGAVPTLFTDCEGNRLAQYGNTVVRLEMFPFKAAPPIRTRTLPLPCQMPSAKVPGKGQGKTWTRTMEAMRQAPPGTTLVAPLTDPDPEHPLMLNRPSMEIEVGVHDEIENNHRHHGGRPEPALSEDEATPKGKGR